MTEVLTADRMRTLEREAIESGRVTGLELMERAGKGAVEAILAEWPELERPGPVGGDRRAVVLCGPGNNGGDGFVVARLLRERGWQIDAFLWGDPERLPPDARTNHDRWAATAPIRPLDEDAWGAAEGWTGVDLIVDALLGIGASGPFAPPGPAGWLYHRLFEDGYCGTGVISRPYCVSLDLPSGMEADTGATEVPPGADGSVMAHLTVAFGAPKPAHLLAEGAAGCGRIRLVPIGLDAEAADPGLRWVRAPLPDPGAVRRLAAKVADDGWCAPAGHKYDHGHALTLSGGMGRGGAARLAARAALRVGAGAVTLACPPSALMENAVRLPDAVMVRALRDAGALREALGDPRINALCLGPGFGTGEREAALLDAALDPGREGPPALVLDADALTILASNEALRAKLRPADVLTPHPGEFARIAPDLSQRLREDAGFSKVDAAREAAARLGATVLLKGPDTVIARPDGRAAIHAANGDRAAPWLATAGAGDVLAGMICGLMARGLDGFDAACAAAWLHVECALAFGPGLTADDLPEALPAVLARLSQGT
ncbi:hydroxyethylthiazole kinase-like uncharacterized protein yjeF/hydroxyethylthiazole kinase-like uncharacterized protein yjeF [Hasllibacter halocynthiae]|uniref:Bifunctional NAD(P)H-hydrate repair enzyme n=1 Tax=Hasllibacter halocynthiae TaxID=595589 RepID=A0A2T0X8W9_9RHOB|nr:NAD(P)H-hydrate dehydratase [Hasllibacter halocynthiae]PRY95392.1 hydroxyethylthiazole kinase-like uncharacterized protein yjeF/hydroxyethylthiazole kinase-like uncharacterized protein yjeF [Hasllibacter halocynthiae]